MYLCFDSLLSDLRSPLNVCRVRCPYQMRHCFVFYTRKRVELVTYSESRRSERNSTVLAMHASFNACIVPIAGTIGRIMYRSPGFDVGSQSLVVSERPYWRNSESTHVNHRGLLKMSQNSSKIYPLQSNAPIGTTYLDIDDDLWHRRRPKIERFGAPFSKDC